MVRNTLRLLFASLTLLSGFCGSLRAQQKITVAAAANLQHVLAKIDEAFEQKTGVKVALITGASGKLSAQIKEGAPFDVFVSADTAYPEELYKSGFTINAPQPYAIGQLVIWTNTPGIKPTADLSFLIDRTVQKIAYANPRTAPYGAAAVVALKHYRLYDSIAAKLVMGENISQAFQFVLTGAATAGFVAKSLVLDEEMKGKGNWIDLEPGVYPPIVQAAVQLKHSKESGNKWGGEYLKFLLSPEARVLFKKYGYELP